ncbi:hypothetical protein MRB53_032532 [Persea americana]|uniref:Uncharacterized protein n=1 Tax=Persea americana TaxID=3435 RepID=A0ACC2KT83_PERAE|nr:hypothetical protein MRB53_032532 [Persea americana]
MASADCGPNMMRLSLPRYCKATGHVIEECRKKARNSTSYNYVQTSPGTSTVSSAPIAYAVTTPQYASSGFSGSLQYDSFSQPGSSQSASPAPLTHEMVNQMIINALASMNIAGTDSSLSNTWYLDSGASNHMTSSPITLQNVIPYTGHLTVQATNGDHLPITSVGDTPGPLPLTNVFVSPHLATNWVSVGQLVENNYNVSFSSSGCVVQDQESGEVIVRGPKHGGLFPLPMSSIIENKTLH